MRAGAVERGDDPDELPRTYAALINAALDGPARRPHRRRSTCAAATSGARGSPRAATSRWPRCCSTSSTSTPTSSSTTTSAPATSRRCASCRPTRPSCSGLISTKVAELESIDALAATRRRGRQVRAARPAVPQPAVRLHQHRARQRHHRRRAVGQAAAHRRRRRPDLGLEPLRFVRARRRTGRDAEVVDVGPQLVGRRARRDRRPLPRPGWSAAAWRRCVVLRNSCSLPST